MRHRPLRAKRSQGAPLYTETWIDRHAPWVYGLLAALDTQPLARVAARAYRPVQAVIDGVMSPLSRGLDGAAAALAAVRRGADRAATSLLAALPLPRLIRDWLWLEPFRADNPAIPSAQALLHRRQRRIWPWARVVAIALHVLVIVYWPTLGVDGFAEVDSEPVALQAPPAVEIPPPPETIQRPATPVLATTDIAEDITIAPTTFEQNPVTELPPPPTEQVVERPARPTITPFTVAPRILNTEEVRNHLIAEYPPALRDAGVGADIIMWFYIDDVGEVQEMRIARGSGYEMLDAAAFRVAERIRFAPALNRDENVAVWVQFPITFSVR